MFGGAVDRRIEGRQRRIGATADEVRNEANAFVARRRGAIM